MAAVGVHRITETFEEEIRKYTGAPYCVAIDNCSNALYLSLLYERISGIEITIPAHNYPSVPCEILRAGGKVKFDLSMNTENGTLIGAYRLKPTRVVDSALFFSSDMYEPNTLTCLSFSGYHKNLKLGKGGAIITDDLNAYLWLKRARFSGRGECSYFEDEFFMTGINAYMLPEIAAKGIGLMGQFYTLSGEKKKNNPLELPYPNLSKFSIYTI